MSVAYQLRNGLADGYQRGRPIRSEAYKRFIRRFACCVCDSTRRVEAAHTGPHGMGTKADDTLCLPLCIAHHQTGPDSLHNLGPLEFARVHRIDTAKLILKLNALFESNVRGEMP